MKMLSASGGFAPLTPWPGALPPDPRYRLVLHSRHGAPPQPLTPSAAYGPPLEKNPVGAPVYDFYTCKETWLWQSSRSGFEIEWRPVYPVYEGLGLSHQTPARPQNQDLIQCNIVQVTTLARSYVWTSFDVCHAACSISHRPMQWEWAIFDPHTSETNRCGWNPKLITI